MLLSVPCTFTEQASEFEFIGYATDQITDYLGDSLRVCLEGLSAFFDLPSPPDPQIVFEFHDTPGPNRYKFEFIADTGEEYDLDHSSSRTVHINDISEDSKFESTYDSWSDVFGSNEQTTGDQDDYLRCIMLKLTCNVLYVEIRGIKSLYPYT